MPSHDIRLTVEHYENGGFGVHSENYEVMGITNIEELISDIKNLMLKELGYIKLEEEK